MTQRDFDWEKPYALERERVYLHKNSHLDGFPRLWCTHACAYASYLISKYAVTNHSAGGFVYSTKQNKTTYLRLLLSSHIRIRTLFKLVNKLHLSVMIILPPHVEQTWFIACLLVYACMHRCIHDAYTKQQKTAGDQTFY